MHTGRDALQDRPVARMGDIFLQNFQENQRKKRDRIVQPRRKAKAQQTVRPLSLRHQENHLLRKPGSLESIVSA